VPVRPRVELSPEIAQGQRDRDLILWPADDPDAGHLASRLAAIAARPLGTADPLPGRGPLQRPEAPAEGIAPVAAPVPAADLAAHLQAARAGAVILPWTRRVPSPCLQLAGLLSLAEWLRTAGLDPDVDASAIPPGARAARPLEDREPLRTEAIARRLARSDTLQPLIRTRAHLVLGGALAGAAWNHDGSLRLETLGRRAR
jgi:hypothetical protein